MSATGPGTTDWFADNAPTIPKGSSGAPKAPATAVSSPSSPQAIPADDWFAANAPGKKQAAPMDKSYAAAQWPNLETDDFSRTLYNMTAAMSGQKLATPEDQAKGEKGKAAGFKSAALTAATGAIAAPLAAPTVGAEEVGTGILDASGKEIMRSMASYGPSVAKQVLAHPLAQMILKAAVGTGVAGSVLKALGLLGGGE